MYTPELKYSELPLDHLRPSGRVYSRSRTPDATTEVALALKKVGWVINELLETELAYLHSLRDIKEGYYLPLVAENKHDAATLDTIFSNVIHLHAFHFTFSGELARNQENLPGLADVFLVHAVDFEKLYVEFCTEHSLSIQTLEHEKRLQTELWAAILACQSQLGHVLPLASYLLKPVQRVLKYQLLLQELIKGCTLISLNNEERIFNEDPIYAVEHLQSALERMMQVATHINEGKRRHELIGQLRASGLDVDQWGRLLLRDVFRLPAKKQSCRLVLLFERAILLAKKFSYTGNNSAPNLTDLQSPWGEGLQSVLEIRDIISCSNLMLIECIDKDPLAFHILPFNNPNAQKTLQAASVEVKQLWCREIKRVILENFDAAIPEKAKHLMLHMEDICPRQVSDASAQMGSHSVEESEEDQAPRRKGSNVLTAIFKRRSRTARPFSIKSQTSEDPAPLSSMVPSSSNGNYASDNESEGSEGDEDDADHVALVQDAWNALMAKHSSTAVNTAASAAVGPLFPSASTAAAKEAEVNNAAQEDEEDDFRCIAVEINEERFAVDLAPPQKSPELKPISSPKGCQNGYVHTPTGGSIYIECQQASQYDTVTFGRAYEHYIAKTRSMATLSPGEMDEILRPLLTLSEDRGQNSALAANGRTRTRTPSKEGAGEPRLPTLASSEDCSDASSNTSSTASTSVCQLVSRIAINSTRANGTGAEAGSATTRPIISPKTHRSSASRATVQSRVSKETARPMTASPSTRSDATKAPPSTKIQRSKPPRGLVSPKTDAASSPRSTKIQNESGGRSTVRTNGRTTLAKPASPVSTATAPTGTNTQKGNEEAASLCQGRFRAAVTNLRPPEGHLAATAASMPSKPPRRLTASTKANDAKTESARLRTEASPAPGAATTTSSVEVRSQGHVRHLIHRFQSN